MTQIARMRTIRQCVQYFKDNDPETRVTESFIRRLIKNKEFPKVNTGTRFLLNIDNLVKFLNNQEQQEDAAQEEAYNDSKRIY